MVRLAIAALTALGALIVGTDGADAGTRVRGYSRSAGTYVAPHARSNRDGRSFNNYSTRGNVNPFTGKAGTHKPGR